MLSAVSLNFLQELGLEYRNNHKYWNWNRPEQTLTRSEPDQTQLITKTRLFKYIENFTTKKLKIFR